MDIHEFPALVHSFTRYRVKSAFHLCWLLVDVIDCCFFGGEIDVKKKKKKKKKEKKGGGGRKKRKKRKQLGSFGDTTVLIPYSNI